MAFRPFAKDRTTNAGLARIQDGVEASVRGSVTGTIADGTLLKDIALTTSATNVPHSLGRPWVGYLVVKSSAAISIPSAGASPDEGRFLNLTASAAATVTLWVF